MSQKNIALEKNFQKSRIRKAIISQTMEWAKKVPMPKLKTLTLPGQFSTFEHLLNEEAEKNGIEVTGQCFEYNIQHPEVYREVCKVIPEN
jgi:hypothetical protein